MTKLTDRYYDGVVVGNDVDPNHAGAVRVKILGVTDDLDMKDQPFAIPAVSALIGVPTEGTILEIVFDEGDVHKPKYFNSSAEKTYLPNDYVNSGYPNIAVANLGDDAFSMLHDRAKKDTLIAHPSNSDILWDNFGRISHDSEFAYENAGQDANVNKGTKLQPVLTQGTIDIFTCKPFGSGSIALQGSEYLFTAHISKDTVDAIKGIGSSVNSSASVNETPQEADVAEYKKVLDEDVLYVRSPAAVQNPGRKVANIKMIVITATGDNNFLDASRTLLDEKNKLSAHYLIGQKELSNSTDGSNANTSEETSLDMSSGFAQYVPIEEESTWFPSSVKSPIESTKSMNSNSVSILLVAKNIAGKTSYQDQKIANIISHVTKEVSLASGVTNTTLRIEYVDVK